MSVCVCRFTSIDLKYQIWKFGVVFTDGVSNQSSMLLALLLSHPDRD